MDLERKKKLDPVLGSENKLGDTYKPKLPLSPIGSKKMQTGGYRYYNYKSLYNKIVCDLY